MREVNFFIYDFGNSNEAQKKEKKNQFNKIPSSI